jgi:hypothetical protein
MEEIHVFMDRVNRPTQTLLAASASAIHNAGQVLFSLPLSL